VNFLRRLALQEKKKKTLMTSDLDVIEIASVPDKLPKLVSFLVGLRTYQHLGTNTLLVLLERYATGGSASAEKK